LFLAAAAVPSRSHDHAEPEADGGEHEYAPEELTTISAATLAPLLPPVGESLNASPFGGLTAYTILVGALPVVTYVASNVVAWPDFSLPVNASMVA
jgi:hypothetical protein